MMNDSELERLKAKWRGKYRSRQTTWQYLEEIRGPVDVGLRGHSVLDKTPKEEAPKSQTDPQGEHND
jgi:hypothetical protein